MTKKNLALPIATMFALFFIIAFVTGLQNPFGVMIKEQFVLSNLESQLGNFANFIAYAFMGIPAGLLLQRVGYKMTAKIAVLVGLVGVLITFLSSRLGNNPSVVFPIYLIGAFVSGFSMCMLNTLGSGGNKGNQLIQFGGACNSIGATIAPVLGGYLMGSSVELTSAALALYIAMAIFVVAFVVLSTVDIPEPQVEKSSLSLKEGIVGPLSYRHFVLGIVAIFIYVGVEVGIPNIANLWMTQPIDNGGLELGKDVAGSVVGTYWFLMLVGRLIGASVASKISSRVMLTSVASVAMILVLLAIFLSSSTTVQMPVFKSDISFGMDIVPVNIMLLVLVGLCTSVMWGGIFNLAVEGLGKYTEAASGIFMVMVCGGGVLPAVQGTIADATSYTASYWLIIAGLAYMLFFALVGSRPAHKE